jgi:hypothetical protein
MDKKTVVGDLLGALARGDSASAGRLMSEDFQFSGAVLKPIGKKEYLSVHEALAAAIPDFDFHPREVKEIDAETLRMTVGITGTHKQTLRMPWSHVEPAPATNKALELPREPVLVRFQGGKVAAIEVETVPGGGVMGILNRVGAKVKTG